MRLAEPLEGAGFGVRSPEEADALFIVELRSDPTLGRFLHRAASTASEQSEWMEAALARDDDLFLLVYRTADGRPEGTAGIYAIDRGARRAEWGRWVLRSGSSAAVESALLVYTLAFEHIGMESVYCRTLRDNLAVLSFHDSAGLRREDEGIMTVDGRHEPYVQHVLPRADWERVRTRLSQLARAVARRMR